MIEENNIADLIDCSQDKVVIDQECSVEFLESCLKKYQHEQNLNLVEKENVKIEKLKDRIIDLEGQVKEEQIEIVTQDKKFEKEKRKLISDNRLLEKQNEQMRVACKGTYL